MFFHLSGVLYPLLSAACLKTLSASFLKTLGAAFGCTVGTGRVDGILASVRAVFRPYPLLSKVFLEKFQNALL